MPLPVLPKIKLQGLNTAYQIAVQGGKPNPNFIIQFNSLIQSLVDQINAIIIAINLAEMAQAIAIAPRPPAEAGDTRPRLPAPAPTLALPVAVAVGASPFSYQAPEAGTVVINGGCSKIEVTRDGTTFVTWTSRTVRVAAGDLTRITYPGPTTPTVTFIEG